MIWVRILKHREKGQYIIIVIKLEMREFDEKQERNSMISEIFALF
jgi:hypothetical protein